MEAAMRHVARAIVGTQVVGQRSMFALQTTMHGSSSNEKKEGGKAHLH
jgi:hypothetical protein